MSHNELNFQPDFQSLSGTFQVQPSSETLTKRESHLDACCDSVNENFLISMLRSPETPENIYWLLSLYLESEKCPAISTDKGKTIYIELDKIENTISVYIGATDSLMCIGNSEGGKLYCMDIIEKYDFVWLSNLGAVLKRNYGAETILSQYNWRQPEPNLVAPLLIFTLGQKSVCTMRTNYFPLADARHHVSNSQSGSGDMEIVSVLDLLGWSPESSGRINPLPGQRHLTH